MCGTGMMENISIAEWLNENTDEYRYLLVDPLKKVAAANPLSLYKLQKILEENAIFPVLRGDLAYSPKHCPHLVLLARPGESCDVSLLNRTETYARSESLQGKRYLCAWLTSAQGPESLAISLAEQCNTLRAQEVLPFFEPLRFELLQAMSPEDGLAGNIWPVSHWWYMTVTGELRCQRGKVSTEQWRLNWGTERTQNNVHTFSQILKYWGKVNPALPSDAAMKTVMMWEQAAVQGLSDANDTYFFTTYSLGKGVDIAQHPAVKNLIQQVVADPSVRLSQLIQGLPDAVIREFENKALTQPDYDKGTYRHGI
jgi:hypothetical protein